MPNTLPVSDKPLLIALQTALNRQLGADIFSITDDGTHISMVVAVPGKPAAKMSGLGTDADGIAGTLSLEGVSDAQPLNITAFGGFDLALTGFELTVAHGRFTDANIRGRISVPFFTNKDGSRLALNIELSPNSTGPFSDPAAALVPVLSDIQGKLTNEGLALLQYVLPASGLDLHIASMQISKGADGNYAIELDGKLLLSIAGLNWPALEFHGLRIDSHGNVALEDGWINLPSQMAIDYFGFKLTLQKLGFGSDNGMRWIGFNGELQLVEGIPLGGSVRGLRLNLNDGALSFTGVSVAFEIPHVLEFSGEIEHVKAKTLSDIKNAGLPDSFVLPAELLPLNVFLGGVHLSITALPKPLEIDAKLIVGNIQGNSVFFLALGVDLPVGIPIFLDVSLYGLNGLFASNLQPDPVGHAHTWWDWFKSPNTGGIAFPGGADDYSATDVHKWLNPHAGAFALGAGAVIGTSHDDGFTVSAGIALVLMLPGPIVTLIGRANILSKRVSAASDERTNFEALATFDGNAKTFDLAVNAHYEIPIVLEIEGTAVLHAGPDGWYFALGKPPHDQRVRARIFDLFETNAYFVVSNDGLLTGTWIGYRNSWRFGPLSVSVNAFMATVQAMQWSPLQIGGGIELHGEAHLRAFGIGIGISVGALLEGCAPNPYWVHGEFHVELETPWPLPDVGATVSLTWGGDDGSIPPAPLALNHLDATLIDHVRTSDHYTLLEHRAGVDSSYDKNLSYDDSANAPGILHVSNASAWKLLTGGSDGLATFPNITNPKQLPFAAVIPQDGHFTLTFAHPVTDSAGFHAEQNYLVHPEVAQVKTPAVLGADDMSNLTLDPPTPQWAFRHSLKQVALYKLSGGIWEQVAATPKGTFPLDLPGGWLPSRDTSGGEHPNTLLKVVPYQLLPSEEYTAVWDHGTTVFPGTDFIDQELQFHFDESLIPARLDSNPEGRIGLKFSSSGKITITFETAVQIVSIDSVQIGRPDGEFLGSKDPMVWRGDGKLLPVAKTTGVPDFTTVIKGDAPAIIELSSTIEKMTGALYKIVYKLPDIPMGILPDAPAFYALKTVTQIERARVSGNLVFANEGDPIIEFAYFRTASGPGIGVMKKSNPPFPAVAPPEISQAAEAKTAALNSDSVFPRGGKLRDLNSYTQWSWPEDGNVAAYFGYDVNVEFNESYINALYVGVPGANSPNNSLHFRCRDRNGAHLAFVPNAIHVPSIRPQSALAAMHGVPQLPATLRPKYQFPFAASKFGKISELVAIKKALAPQAVKARESQPKKVLETLLDIFAAEADLLFKQQERIASDSFIETASTLAEIGNVKVTRDELRRVTELDPIIAGLLLELAEAAAAAEARSLWFQPLRPRTRYTLDVVAGPLVTFERMSHGIATFASIYSATDAISALKALKAFYKHEDELTTLERVQFTTSRYRTFSEQLSNAVAQTKERSGAPPFRRLRGKVDPISWYGVNGVTHRQLAEGYLNTAKSLGSFVTAFNPMGDNVPPIKKTIGQQGLIARRAVTETAWQAFTAQTISLFDQLIAALGHEYLASNRLAPPPPETELSALTDDQDHITALLIESPEPLPWRRIWRWISLRFVDPETTQPGRTKSSLLGTAPSFQSALMETRSPFLSEFLDPSLVTIIGALAPKSSQLTALRNRDGTRGLLIPDAVLGGTWTMSMEFHGNIGAEMPSITSAGKSVRETVEFAPLVFRPQGRRFSPAYNFSKSRHRLFRIMTGHGGEI
ncbi:MAG: hypothetical protein M3410_03020 [Acidobacteriota bacterium]|nr:hypothetical protein [Acidobacteriota bacterium]